MAKKKHKAEAAPATSGGLWKQVGWWKVIVPVVLAILGIIRLVVRSQAEEKVTAPRETPQAPAPVVVNAQADHGGIAPAVNGSANSIKIKQVTPSAPTAGNGAR